MDGFKVTVHDIYPIIHVLYFLTQFCLLYKAIERIASPDEMFFCCQK
jgi:hypothetical protein